MANDPGAGEGSGSPSTPSVIYSASASGSSSGNRTSSLAARKTARQQKALQDASGSVIIGADDGGFGLKRPYLDWRVYRTADETTPPEVTTSGSFVSLFTCASEPQHPKIRVRYKVVNGAGTSSEIRLVDRTSGTVVAGPDVIGSAVTQEGQLEGSLVAPTLSGSGAPMKVDVQARRTGGANNVTVMVIYAMGKEG